MSERIISAALSARLQALGLPTAYENAPFTPTVGVLFVSESILPRETVPVGMEYASSNDHGGIYQVLVMAPKDKGKGPGQTAAEQVRAHFPRGLTLTREGVTVRVERAYQSGAYSSGDRWVIPVSIRYRAFANG